MSKKLKKYILKTTLIFIFVSLLFNILAIITYQYDIDNCEQIIKHNQLTTNDATIRCIKIMNQPIYSYYLPTFLANWVLCLFFIGCISALYAFIRNEIDCYYFDDEEKLY